MTWSSLLLLAPLLAPVQDAAQPDPWVVYQGGVGPGAGKHIVLLAGDEEYRSEEALPMLARILSVHHGFKCTVLFSTNPEDGTIDPTNQTNVPGMEQLATADMLIVFFRFRELPDEDMQHFVDYVESGKPILGIRTSTHAFDYKRNKDSKFARYHWRGGDWKDGFGRQILGETWISHHGGHGSQSTRGVVEPGSEGHPILKGLLDVWGPTDVYGTRELPAGTQVLLRGQVVQGMRPDDPPAVGEKNDPMMPLVWVREFEGPEGKPTRAICSTIGASVDMQSAGLRRLLVNACYWGMRLEERMPDESRVDYVGAYEPTTFGFDKWTRGRRAADFALKGD
jgi:hypothetical protein